MTVSTKHAHTTLCAWRVLPVKMPTTYYNQWTGSRSSGRDWCILYGIRSVSNCPTLTRWQYKCRHTWRQQYGGSTNPEGGQPTITCPYTVYHYLLSLLSPCLSDPVRKDTQERIVQERGDDHPTTRLVFARAVVREQPRDAYIGYYWWSRSERIFRA